MDPLYSWSCFFLAANFSAGPCCCAFKLENNFIVWRHCFCKVLYMNKEAARCRERRGHGERNECSCTYINCVHHTLLIAADQSSVQGRAAGMAEKVGNSAGDLQWQLWLQLQYFILQNTKVFTQAKAVVVKCCGAGKIAQSLAMLNAERKAGNQILVTARLCGDISVPHTAN